MVNQAQTSVYFLISLAVVCASDMRQLYFSVNRNSFFRPTANDSTIGQSTYIDEKDCPLMCLALTACQMAMHSSTDGSCTLYNSVDGTVISRDGYIIYTANDRVSAAQSTVETTTTKQVATETAPTCLTGTFRPFNTNLIALWRFDGNVTDAQGTYNGMLLGDAAFSTDGYMNASLSLSGEGSSCVQVPNVNLVSTSFTIELWMRLVNIPDTNMILVSQNALTLRVVAGGYVSISQTRPGSASYLPANRWHHIALVYDNSSGEQDIYVNGKLDSLFSMALAFNTTSAFYIGSLDGTTELYSGEIDHLSITARIKSPCELLRDASLLASYSFTYVQQAVDSGPYGIHGTVVGSAPKTPGRVGDGFSVSDETTYFQVNGLTGLTTAGGEYSFTFFISPSSIRGCVLIYVSSTSDISDASKARPYLGIDSSGNLVAVVPPDYTYQTSLNIPINQWSHIAFTYSYARNNISVYYNGLLYNSTDVPGDSYGPTVTTPPVFLTLANPLGNQYGTIIPAQSFHGIIDELNIWSRELNASDVYAAANPNT